MNIRRWFLVPVVALLSFVALSFGSTGSFAQETSTAEKVTVLTINDYTVKRGDHLTGVAGRFGVSAGSILESNPQVAKRTTKGKRYWLYIGERISVPVYISEVKTVNNVGDDTLVAVPMGKLRTLQSVNAELANQVTAANQSIAALQNQLTAAQEHVAALEKDNKALADAARVNLTNANSWKALFFILFAFFAILIFAMVLNGSKRPSGSANKPHRHVEPEKSPEHFMKAAAVAAPATSCCNEATSCCHEPLPTPSAKSRSRKVTAETLVEKARKAPLKELVAFADMPIVHDENNNSVTIKKIKHFASQPMRSGMEDCTLEEMEQTFAAKKAAEEHSHDPNVGKP